MDSHSENSASLNCTLNAASKVHGTDNDEEERPITEETPISMDSSETIPDLDSNDDKGDSAEAELHFCDLDELVEPKVGMIFDTAKEALDYYNEYARKIGFRVRILRTNAKKGQRDKIHRQVLVCSCEGSYKMVRKPRKRRETKRFECMAVFEIKLMSGGDKYALIRFKAEHTHELGPTKFSRHLKTPAHVPHADSSLPRGVKAADIPEEVGLSDPNSRSGFLKRGDAHFLLEYFRQKKQENKHFFYSFRTDGDGNICGVFYCDAKSRRDYGLFGDAVCFDTTFKTNDMVCVPVIGINNHGQPALFGCGLLDGETADSAVWLFTTFLEAMGGKKPISVFTSESAFISNAVSAVFPEAHHGLCLWHLFQNASKHLTEVFKASKSFSVQFKSCIYDPETLQEFEESWSKLLDEYGLRGIAWLQGLYELRKMWAQSRGHFCAGMTATGRSENISKFLKAYFSTGSIPLRELVDQYSKAMVDQYGKENEAEKRTHQTEPNLISAWPIEREASKLYTREMFYGFQEELQQIIDLLLELVSDDGIIRTYRATEMEGQKKIRTLIYNHTEQSVYCSCKKFEFNGILCSHALKLFRNLQYKTLPPKYYLKRWTRKATEDDVFDPSGELIPNNSDPSSTARYDALLQISQRIATKCSKSEEVFSLTNLILQEVEAKMEGRNTKEEQRPTVQKTTIETTPAVQKTTIETTPAVQKTTIETTPAVQKTTIETTLAVQKTNIETTLAVQETKIETTPAVQKTTIKTTPAVQETTIKTTPAVQKTTIKTTPAVRKTTIKTTPTVRKTTIKTTPTVRKTTIKTTPAVKKTTTRTNPAVKKTTTKTNRNQASGLLQVQQQANHSQTGWQWMNQRAVPPLRAIQPLQVVYPQGVYPRDILPPYNSVTCQQRRPLFAPQQ
ncbi:protein FAR1-RELATED SEQUENCE 5-like [Papaver somniferum]|nr:protein FAR1-RELATED SEQUENCE 5-like [Papaver somniferum]